MGSGPRIQIRHPFTAHLLEREWPDLGDSEELTGLQACIQKLVDKKLKLVNLVQVMLIRRILPFQRRGFNMWEFDPAQHQTLSGLFDTMYEDVWKVLFKGAEAPASATEDRGFRSQRPADEVSDFATCFP